MIDFDGERIVTTSTRTNLGSRRQWFLCTAGDRRCAIIYWRGEGPAAHPSLQELSPESLFQFPVSESGRSFVQGGGQEQPSLPQTYRGTAMFQRLPRRTGTWWGIYRG
ncbi:hypothetical protein [Pontibaca salina]|uniref:Uncharacterized protein n=1 Tax=Pontibaca salina TaxID=2795731 RepID=A0A934HT83_9RHOB|nr:hypothetical protein [Pontibaca salina]MBI6630105.1 hypothetical protein [Pontibaca salina]